MGCAAPTPIPPIAQQYPATWTPAPAPTNTPPAPTATRVVQNSPAPLPTPDPNVRTLPTNPRGTIGVWMNVSDSETPNLKQLASGAQVLVSDHANTNLRQPKQFFLMQSASLAAGNNLANGVGGIILAETAANNPAASGLRESIKPRPVLASVAITDTNKVETLSQTFDGLLLDNFIRTPQLGAMKFPSENAWRQNIDTLARLSSNPNTVLLTKTYFPPSAANAPTDFQPFTQYAVTSFLLGVNNTHTFFGAEDASAQQYISAALPLEPLGNALGSYFRTNGVYQRRFTNGLVWVNPGDKTRAFFLPRPYRDAGGVEINQVELPPHSGQILYAIK